MLEQSESLASLWGVWELLLAVNTGSSLQIMMRRFVKLLLETIIERDGYPCEVLDEDSVIVEHAEDFLSLLYSFGEWYGENHFDLFSLR